MYLLLNLMKRFLKIRTNAERLVISKFIIDVVIIKKCGKTNAIKVLKRLIKTLFM